jgi:N-acetylglucosaminyldiphosphoundecaprenol N-acetyl-beta-D-mannosaminyltransferase
MADRAASPVRPPAGTAGRPERTRLAGLDFDLITHDQLIEHVAAAIKGGDGGTIVTPNVDICRRTRRDPLSRDLVGQASLVVPDGMPLLWAARLAGRPLTQRITGAELIFSLSEAAAAASWPVYLIGGRPGADGDPGVAERAGRRLAARYPDLVVAGAYSPPDVFDAAADDIEQLRDALRAAAPALVFVGLGFPKQEQLIARLRGDLGHAWLVGCGAAIPLAAGEVRRAPDWMQRAGLEWLHRLLSEPRRLASRYLVHDLPFAVRLLVTSAMQRVRAGHGGPPAAAR